jgi:hypothetical protein
VADRLELSAFDLASRIATDPRLSEFVKWFARIQNHPEFLELERRIAKVSSKSGAQRDFEFNVFWNAWRAVTWKPPSAEETIATLERLMEAGAAGEDFLLQQFQHGPFIYPQGGVTSKTRLANSATLLAAQLAGSYRRRKLQPDWVMLAMLVRVVGIGEAEPGSLRVAARKLIQAVESREIMCVAWPQDTGATFESLQEFLAPFGVLGDHFETVG